MIEGESFYHRPTVPGAKTDGRGGLEGEIQTQPPRAGGSGRQSLVNPPKVEIRREQNARH
jgi:hypothetical protein